MMLKKINGKRKSPDIRKKEAERKAEQLKYFVSHMRTIENSISTVKSMAVNLKWDELNLKLISCHKHILDTLLFVKNSGKLNNEELLDLNKPKQKPEYLKLLKQDKE